MSRVWKVFTQYRYKTAVNSSVENNGLLLDLHNNTGAMAYGIEELEKENPLAWPGFATD
ncbi:MAG: hypothetical protein ACR2P1_02420 [Pseudomonadales bacterium]